MNKTGLIMAVYRGLNNFMAWRIRHISNKNFIILVSIVVGVFAGLAAVSLKWLVHFIQKLLQYDFDVAFHNYLYLIYPLIGILLTVLYVNLFHKRGLERGIGNVLYKISKRSSYIEKDKSYSHIISSALTVGFGGSAGLESPIVVTGSALGSNIARLFNLNYKERTLLLACGAASGIAAVFNSPIAGVIFALEVLLAEFTIPYFIPLLIASASASLISHVFYGGQLFVLITGGWNIEAIPFYVLLGIVAGLTSVYITKVALFMEHTFSRWKKIYLKAITGGLLLGVFIFFLPPLYGEGYLYIEHLMRGAYHRLLDNSLFYEYRNEAWMLLLLTGIIIPLKIVAASITIVSGGNGGTFAPSLFTGAFMGFFFAFLTKTLGIADLSITNFVVVAMAGILSGVNHAPLTAIFLIAEITGGYVLFIPLMIVSALSYFIARYIEPHTVHTKVLAEKGDLVTHDKDKNVLNQMKLRKLLEDDFSVVSPEYSLGELVDIVAGSKRNIFPVTDKDNKLMGIVALDNIREVMFQAHLYKKLYVKNLMAPPPFVIDINDDMKEVMQKFDDSEAWNLPVTEDGRYMGFVSKSNIFTQYRNVMINQTKEIDQF